MGELYLRRVEVEIIPALNQGIKITELRTKFKCEKNNEGHPNKASIEIYNLSDKTRALFEAKNTRVQLSIGYLGLRPNGLLGTGFQGSSNVEAVFIGNISKVKHDRDNVDIVTKLEVKDGGNKFRNSRLDKGFPPGVKIKDIIQELADSMGLPVSSLQGIPDKNYANGFTVSGLVRDHLNKLALNYKFEWSIQDETLQIIPQDKTTDDGEILLTPDSGLLGVPAKTDKGVEFSCLIQPRLKPGKRVRIESRTLTGSFKLRKVSHEGDSTHGDFISKVEATLR